MDNGFVVFSIALATFSLGFSICNLMWQHESNKIVNSPELTQSGTTWQGGECVIILNK